MSNKFNSVLMKKHTEDTIKVQKQEELKEKHNIQEENVVVVEKPSLLISLLRGLVGFIRFVAVITMILLTIVGIVALVTGNVREELFKVWEETLQNIQAIF